MIYEVFLPVVDGKRDAVPPTTFQSVVEQLIDQFGFVETCSVYQSVGVEDELVVEAEYLRLSLEVPNASDNHVWMHEWKLAQQARFDTQLWMIRYRVV